MFDKLSYCGIIYFTAGEIHSNQVPGWLADQFNTSIAHELQAIEDEPAAQAKAEQDYRAHLYRVGDQLAVSTYISGMQENERLTPQAVRDWRQRRNDPVHYPIRAITATLEKLCAVDGTKPNQLGYDDPISYAMGVISASNVGFDVVADIDLRSGRSERDINRGESVIGSGLLLTGPSEGQIYLVINNAAGTIPGRGGFDHMKPRFAWLELNRGQLDVLQRKGSVVELATAVGTRIDDPDSWQRQYNERVHDPRYRSLVWTTFMATGPLQSSDARIDAPQGANVIVSVAERLKPQSFLVEAYRRIPDAPTSPETLILAFGAAGREQLELSGNLDFVEVTELEAHDLRRLVPFFVGDHSAPSPLVVPFAYQLDALAAAGLPTGRRWQAGEGVVAGHMYSISGLASQIYGNFSRAEGTIPAAYLTAYADALLQLYSTAEAWRPLLEAQNLQPNALGPTSAAVYLRNDANRPTEEQIIPDWARGDGAFQNVDLLAGYLAAQAQLGCLYLRSGSTLAPQKLDQILALAEMSANGTDMMGLAGLLRDKLNS